MATLHVLMIGHEGALKYPRAQEIKSQLTKGDLSKVFVVSQPEDLAKLGATRQKFDVWIFVANGSHVPLYSVWKLHLSRLKESQPVVAVVSDRVLPATVVDQFNPKYIALGNEPIAHFCTKILNHKSSESKIKDLTNRAATVSQTQMETPMELPQSNPLEELVAGLDEEVRQEQAHKTEVSLAHEQASPNDLSLASTLNDLVVEPQGVASGSSHEEPKSAVLGSSVQEDPSFLKEAVSVSGSEDPAEKASQIFAATRSSALTKNSALGEAASEKFILSEAASQPSLDLNQVIQGGINSIDLGKSSAEFETLNRFALLKEREAREREATIQVLNRQLTQMKEKIARSEVERRRLQVAFDEAQVTMRALEEARDQHQNQLRKLDAQYQERNKAIQAKLDNAQFSATRAEKKLEEFKERVRNDILRIRLRERELGNKLELQKRDAEALLTSKDERLLEQKREIDRLEYEMELLKERMIENTARAEERAAKLSRALQSLKMAQGVLTGIEEEVIPTAESMKDDSGQDAA